MIGLIVLLFAFFCYRIGKAGYDEYVLGCKLAGEARQNFKLFFYSFLVSLPIISVGLLFFSSAADEYTGAFFLALSTLAIHVVSLFAVNRSGAGLAGHSVVVSAFFTPIHFFTTVPIYVKVTRFISAMI